MRTCAQTFLGIILIFSTFGSAEAVLPEEALSDQPVDTGPLFGTSVSVLSTSPTSTLLEIHLNPLYAQKLPSSREEFVGLVAVAHTGQIRASVVSMELSPLADLDTMLEIPAISVPESFVHVGTPGIWRDIRVVSLGLVPCMRIHDENFVARRVIVEIKNAGGVGINEKTRPVRPVSPIWERMYRQHVLNYDSLNLPRLTRGTGKRYIVISRSLFDSQTPQFEDWKTLQGYGVELKTLEDLGHTTPHTTAAMEATKNYILDAYNNWSETPEFVLLVGDMYSGNYAGSIWTKDFYNYFYSQGNKPHDQWYGFLEGDDLFADVMLGRLPDSNTSRMDYLFAKTIGYEKEPYINGTWQKNALMTLATYHWDPDVNEHITEAKNYVSDLLSVWGMNVTERFQGQANASQILPVINQGLTFYNYRGSLCGSTDWNGTFSDNDVQYVNNANKLGVWTVLSCSSGNFDYGYPITAELLLRHGYPDTDNPKGAVAFIGSQAYTSYLYNDPLDKGFYLAWTDIGASILGEAFLSAKIHAWNNSPGLTSNKRGSAMKEYTILGDPSLQVWTDVPTSITVNASPSSVPIGQSTDVQVSVSTTALAPVAGALVCLMKDSDVYAYGYTNGAGNVTLPVQPTTTGDIDLTVTGYNRIPYYGTVPATSGTPTPLNPESISAELSGSDDILLTWSPVTQDITGSPITIDHYDVYRNTVAYYETSGLTPVASPSFTHFTDNGAAKNFSVNYFYRVVAVSTSSVESAPSATVGEFDFASNE